MQTTTLHHLSMEGHPNSADPLNRSRGFSYELEQRSVHSRSEVRRTNESPRSKPEVHKHRTKQPYHSKKLQGRQQTTRNLMISSTCSPTHQCHRRESKWAVANQQIKSLGKPKLTHKKCAKGRSAKETEGACLTLNDSSSL